MTILVQQSDLARSMNNSKIEITDQDIIFAICNRNESICKQFYLDCRTYFFAKHKSVIIFKSREYEILDLYQDAFSLLYSEIESKRITVVNNKIVRKDTNGDYHEMTAKLKTFLLSIAKIKSLSQSRKNNELSLDEAIIPDLIDSDDNYDEIYDIVNYCVNFMLPDRCKHILTLFYYENKSLDEILEIRKENTSKDGLKTSKSKCMAKLKFNILNELKRNNITVYHGK